MTAQNPSINQEREWMAQGQVPWLADVTRNGCRSFYLLSETGNEDLGREKKRGKGLRFERTDGVK